MTRQQAGVSAIRPASDHQMLCEIWDALLATAPPEQAAPKDLGSALRIDNMSRTSIPVVREETAPQAMLKAERAEAVGDMLEAYENARAITMPADPPQAVSAGALSVQDYVERFFAPAVEFIKQHGYRDWDGSANGQTTTLTGCANMLAEALAVHDQKVRAETCEEIASQHSLYPGAITIMCSCGTAFNHIAFVAAEEWKTHIRSLAAPAPAASKPEASPSKD